MKPQIYIVGILVIIGAAVFTILTQQESAPEPVTAPNLRIEVNDGSGVSAAQILNATWSLTAEKSIPIGFETDDGESTFLTAMSRERRNDFPIDAMFLELGSDQFILNDQILALNELRERLREFVKVARIVETEPLILVAADVDAAGAELVDLFEEFTEAGLTSFAPILNEKAAKIKTW